MGKVAALDVEASESATSHLKPGEFKNRSRKEEHNDFDVGVHKSVAEDRVGATSLLLLEGNILGTVVCLIRSWVV